MDGLNSSAYMWLPYLTTNQQGTFLPAGKVAVNSSKITWCFHYHHCTASEAPGVASLLKIIVEISHPILKMQQYNIAVVTDAMFHTIENMSANSSRVIGLYMAETLQSSVSVNQCCNEA